MAKLPRSCLLVALPYLVLLGQISTAAACPFCDQGGQTLTGEVKQATMVLYGTLANADKDKDKTDLLIESVVKKPEDPKLLGNGKVLTIDRYLAPDVAKKYKFLVFCDVFRGRVDAYKSIALEPNSDVAKYLKGALEVQNEKQPKRLRFFFDYLDNADVEISNDAMKEFANADYTDYKDMARDLPADKIAGWLGDKNTPSFRYGLYASLLGHCGKAEHADLLRSMLDDKNRVLSGTDGIMAAYVMLRPKDGWAYVRDTLKNEAKDFNTRWAALRSVRFLWLYRSDLVEKKDMAEAVAAMIGQKDIADMAVEDLRKWQCWDMSDRILALRKTPVYEQGIVRRAVLRYALQCAQAAGHKGCKAYVDEIRAKNPDMVSEVEELLKQQQDSVPAPAIKK